jgi:hypothetical protein
VLLFVGTVAAQTTTQERTTSSQQQMKAQPAQTTVQQVKPLSPVKTDLRIDTRRGDIAAAGATEFMVIDLQGNGLDLGGRAKIQVGGSEFDTNWTRLNTADGFLMVDTAVLRETGFELRDTGGLSIQNRILVSDSLRLRGPDGNEVEITDSWRLLGQFDSNKDGRINSSDAAWQSLSVFVDANADGTMGEEELKSLADSGVRDFSLVKSEARTDTRGNTLTDGTFTRPDGTTNQLAGVKLRRY